MSNKIGIVMGGYLDENDKLMGRTELNRRITAIQEENRKMREGLEYYADTSHKCLWVSLYDCHPCDDEERIDGVTFGGKRARQILNQLDSTETITASDVEKYFERGRDGEICSVRTAPLNQIDTE